MSLHDAFQDWLIDMLPVMLGFSLFFALIIVLMFRSAGKNIDKWEQFKQEHNCKLVEVDETGFFGKKYKWQCEDGTTIINIHSK